MRSRQREMSKRMGGRSTCKGVEDAGKEVRGDAVSKREVLGDGFGSVRMTRPQEGNRVPKSNLCSQ